MNIFSRLIRPTVLRLPSKEVERHATWLEIFFDLIFSVIITELGGRLFEHFTYMGVLECLALFIPVMWTWTSYTVFSARFDNDDSVHWFLTFIIMFAGIIMAIQMPVALEEGAFIFSLGFILAQLSLVLLYLRVLYDFKAPKNLTTFYLIGFTLGVSSWIISLFYEGPAKFVFWTLGMCIYLIAPWTGKKILAKAPLHHTYLPERFGSWTVIILGQTIASVVFGLRSANWEHASVTTSILAFVLAVLAWGQYCRMIEIADFKSTLKTGQPFIYAHIPLIISLIVMGVCMEKFIITPKVLNESVDLMFSFAVLLYVSSCYLLHYITVRTFKPKGLLFAAFTLVLVALFLLDVLSIELTLVGIDIVFVILFIILYMHPKAIYRSRRKSLKTSG